MKGNVAFIYLLLVLNPISIRDIRCEDFDPYKVLNVYKNSGPDDIRKAYKKLAKEWHPDKNKDPSAGERFTEINRAYEILGDEKRRDQYDRFGRVDDNPSPTGGGDGQRYQFFRTPYGDFQFHFDDMFGDGGMHMDRITDRFLQNTVLPDSFRKPYLFFATTNFCFPCMRIQPIWNQFTEELKAIELSYGIVDVDSDLSVTRRLQVSRIPSIGAVVNGRSVFFQASEYNVKNLREFTRKLFPDDLFHSQLKSLEAVDGFLSGWKDNKVRALFFGQKFQPSVRLLISLNQLADYYRMAYIELSSASQAPIIDRYEVSHTAESLLIFDEGMSEPSYAFTAEQKKFSTSELYSLLDNHKYLKLPRLNRVSMLDDLCPINTGDITRHCLILTIHSSLYDKDEVTRLRDLATVYSSLPNIKFLYLFTDLQKSFMEALKRPAGDYQVALIARLPEYAVYYKWIDWCTDACYTRLEKIIKRLNTGERYDYPKRSVKRYDIKDEFQASLFKRIMKRLRDWWDHFTYTYFEGDHMLLLASILSTVECVVIVSFLLHLMSNQSGLSTEDVKLGAQKPSRAAVNGRPYNPAAAGDKFTVYDLRSHNYDKLIKESPSGYRLILLLTDTENKSRLLRRFADICMPFQKTPYFVFGFCYIDKYLSWYQRLLSQAMASNKDLVHMRVEQCVGSVLAINGSRKYFNIYHPKTLNVNRNNHGGADFIGFDDSSSESEHEVELQSVSGGNGLGSNIDGETILTQDKVLEGLSHWLDRLFDGSIPKCKIDRWPIFPVDSKTSEEEKKDQ